MIKNYVKLISFLIIIHFGLLITKKRELYKKLPKIYFGYKHIIINDDDAKLIKNNIFNKL